MSDTSNVILVSADAAICDAILSMAAAQNVPITHISKDPLLVGWPTARTVLVGADLAPKVMAAAPPPHPKTVVVGFDAETVCTWSLPLNARVAVLPDATKWLPGLLVAGAWQRAPMVAVVGGSGGVGCSTLAAGLAITADRDRVGLVDIDPLGGGIDLLLGLEQDPGWRWTKFRGAGGTIEDIVSLLPHHNQVSVLSMSRHEPMLASGPVLAVLDSLRRNLDLVIVDIGRSPTAMAREVVRNASKCVLLVGESVRAVAAAAEVIAAFDLQRAQLVVRGRNRFLANEIAQTLGLPLSDCLPHDRQLPILAERGQPPSNRQKTLTKTCRKLVGQWL